MRGGPYLSGPNPLGPEEPESPRDESSILSPAPTVTCDHPRMVWKRPKAWGWKAPTFHPR